MLCISMFASSALYASSPKMGKYPQVFQGGDYIVTMLRLGDTEDKTFLIKVDGIDNDFDGEIYKHITKCNNKRCTSYKLETSEIPGKKRWWTIQSKNSWGNNDGLVLYPPGVDKKSFLYKTKRPEDFNSKNFYQTYLGQKAQR